MHDTSQKPGRPDAGYTQADWDEVSDNSEMTRAELAEMRPASEVPEVYNLLPKRGRPKSPNAKVNVTVRIDPQILEAYRATGEGWQVRMGDALAAGLQGKRPNRSQHHHGDRPMFKGIVTERSFTGSYAASPPRAGSPRASAGKPKTKS